MNVNGFKPGDRVRYTGKHPDYSNPTRIGWQGTVREVRRGGVFGSEPIVTVDFDNGDNGGHYPENLEVIAAGFRAGDRVRYIGESRRYRHLTGTAGTVESDPVPGSRMMRVKFDVDGIVSPVLAKNLEPVAKVDQADTLAARARKLDDEAAALELEANVKRADAARRREQARKLRDAEEVLKLLTLTGV
ncbi:hypothetical protein GCM10029963_28870 [Micromonospora andamanensis]|uniref:hypothetical protein n=1 Tax=Micromonospora andamanensis TaxID=1287068 RepID=UPI00194F5960|nr:hypothetical protein [Micromonospora andamanensis]GIJ38480.1 hypothetical protein Vwe01_18050 [Micromonospora andamanensis]